jgi:hypothetical protein
MYYAAYLEAREWCETRLGYQRERFGREHADVQRMLMALDPDLADSLAFLRGYRNTADYDLHVSVDTLRAQKADAMDRVENVIARLDTLVPPAPADPGTGDPAIPRADPDPGTSDIP